MTIQEKIYCYINKHINMEILNNKVLIIKEPILTKDLLKIKEAIKVLNLGIDNIIVED